MKILETQRLVLRQWEPEDAGFVLDLYSRWEVQRFIGNHPQVMRDRSQADERIRAWRHMDSFVHGAWAVELKGLPQGEYGPSGQGQGYDQTPPLAGTLLLKSIPASGASLPPGALRGHRNRLALPPGPLGAWLCN